MFKIRRVERLGFEDSGGVMMYGYTCRRCGNLGYALYYMLFKQMSSGNTKVYRYLLYNGEPWNGLLDDVMVFPSFYEALRSVKRSVMKGGVRNEVYV